MYKIIVAFSLYFWCINVYTQNSIIRGIVTDSISYKPIEYVNITLLSKGDSIISGVMSDSLGEFKLECGDNGYKVILSHLGYLNKEVVIDDNEILHIKLQPNAEIVESIDVKGVRVRQKKEFDKDVYYLNDNLVASSSSIIDILRKIPGVSVDIENNNVLYFGSIATLKINNKPADRLYKNIESIPVDNIQSVEVVEPAMRGAGSGKAGGIINLKIKVETKEGVSGVISNRAGISDTKDLTMLFSNINLNYKFKNNLIYSNYSNYNNKNINKEQYTGSVETNNIVSQINNNVEHLSTDNYNRANIGLLHEINKTSKISLTVDGALFKGNETLNDDRMVASGTQSLYLNTIREGDRKQNYLGVSIDYNNEPDTLGKEIVFNSYLAIKKYDEEIFEEQYFKPLSFNIIEKNVINPLNTQLIFYLYYNHPISSNFRFNAEYNGFNIFSLKEKTNTYRNSIIDRSLSYNDDITWLENTLSFHIGGKFDKITTDIGLTVQSGYRTGQFNRFNTKDTIYNVSKNDFHFLPSAIMKYNISEKLQAKISYNMSASNPWVMQMCDYIDKSNPLVWRKGNSNLSTEINHSIFAGISFVKDKYNVSLLAFEKYENNAINELMFQKDSSIFIQQPINIGSNNSIGVNLNTWFLVKILSFTFDFDLLYRKTNLSNLDQFLSNNNIPNDNLVRSNLEYEFNLNVDLNAEKFTTSFYFAYNSSRLTTFGSESGLFESKLSVSKRFVNNQLYASISINNLSYYFQKNEERINTVGQFVIREYDYLYYHPGISISLRYNINKGHRNTRSRW